MTALSRGEQPFLFVSYASVDRARALAVVEALRTIGVVVWLDQNDIPGGANWAQQITESIAGCSGVILLSSAASLSSRNVRSELGIAWRYHKPIIPLLLDPTPAPTELQYFLELSQWIELLDHPTALWLPKVERALRSLGILGDAGVAPDSQSLQAGPPVALGTRPSATIKIPTPLTAILGREADVDAVVDKLRSTRLVTLVGPGGVGKTRLAIAVAQALVSEFPDGVVFVDLSGLYDPSQVLSTIASALQLMESGDEPVAKLLEHVIAEQRLLLVLDNMEHVIESAGEIGTLLTSCAKLHVLATSRVPLRLRGEWEFPVNPLSVDAISPHHGHSSGAVGQEAGPAVALFVERAQAIRPDFRFDAANGQAIRAICQRLDGLPLAIELAAARIRLLSPEQIAQRLDQPLAVLASGASDLPERQRTLRSAIQWSYELLTTEERHFFQRLSVFAGGWTVDAAEAVAGNTVDVFTHLEALVGHSLVRVAAAMSGETRFDMLQTIREFGLDQLRSSPVYQDVRRAHAVHFAAFAEEAARNLTGADQPRWLDALSTDYDNLRAALAWSRDHEPSLGLRLAASLGYFWYVRGPVTEGRSWLESILARDDESDLAMRAAALYALAGVAVYQHDAANARLFGERARDAYRELSDRRGLAKTLNSLANAAVDLEEFGDAEVLLSEALALFRSLDDRRNLTIVLGNLGWLATLRADYASADEYLTEGLTIARQGDDRAALANVLTNLGWVALDRGELQRAEDCFREAVRLGQEQQSTLDLIEGIEGLAAVHAIADRHETAARWISAVVAARTHYGAGLFSEHSRRLERLLDQSRMALGLERWEAAAAAGSRLGMADVAREVLGDDHAAG